MKIRKWTLNLTILTILFGTFILGGCGTIYEEIEEDEKDIFLVQTNMIVNGSVEVQKDSLGIYLSTVFIDATEPGATIDIFNAPPGLGLQYVSTTIADERGRFTSDYLPDSPWFHVYATVPNKSRSHPITVLNTSH